MLFRIETDICRMNNSNQGGFIGFITVAAVMPVIFLLLILGIEIVGYFRAKQELHTSLERELEILSRNLNSRDAGEKILLARMNNALSSLGIELESSAITWQKTVPPEATLKLKGYYQLRFPSFPIFSRLLNASSLPINANATVQLAPLSAALIIDTSHMMAPSSTEDSLNSRWYENGISVGASWFNTAPPLYYNNQTIPALHLSLRCFNSKLSSVKRAAITLIDLLQYFGGTKYYLSFLSDRPSDYSTINVSAASDLSSNNLWEGGGHPLSTRHLGDYPSGPFNPYISFYGRDAWCAAAAISEQLHTGLFSIPSLPTFASAWRTVGPTSHTILGSLSPPKFSTDYLTSAPLREQIWFRAASEQDDPVNWIALNRCTDALLETTTYSKPTAFDINSDITRKALFVITDRLPINNGTLLDQYRSTVTLIGQKALILDEKLVLHFILIDPIPEVKNQIASFKNQTRHVLSLIHI